MSDGHGATGGPQRRDVLRYGVAAVGLVWAAPAIRSVQVVSVEGSPPPEPSTTTTMPATTYAFAGEWAPVPINESTTPSCSIFLMEDFAFTAALGSLGTSTVSIEYCKELTSFVRYAVSGALLLTNGDGTISGTLTGEMIRTSLASDWGVHLDIDITGGTGSFDGATGSAVVDSVRVFDFSLEHFWGMYGTIAGSFIVPS